MRATGESAIDLTVFFCRGRGVGLRLGDFFRFRVPERPRLPGVLVRGSSEFGEGCLLVRRSSRRRFTPMEPEVDGRRAESRRRANVSGNNNADEMVRAIRGDLH